jgi:hypothetical protein
VGLRPLYAIQHGSRAPEISASGLNEAHLHTGIFSFEEACGIVFNQSEQAFLSFLKKSSQENYKALKSLPPTLGNDQHDITHIRLNLYSTYDICHYCRGTLAYMLYNGTLKENIRDFFRQQTINLNLNQSDFQIYAFSNKSTDIRMGCSR